MHCHIYNTSLYRLSRIVHTEVINFDLWIERVDGVFPDQDIIIDISLELPSEVILNSTLDNLSVSMKSVAESEVTVLLNRSVLSYVSNTSMQLLHFEGRFLPNVPNGQVIKLNGSLVFIVDPYTFTDYVKYFTFPDIYFIRPTIEVERLIFDSFIEGSAVVIWELVLTNIAGSPFDLTVDIYVDTDVLHLLFVDVQSVG